MALNESYDEFVEKFKPKLTTDDCYTPEPVYIAVRDYVSERYGVQPADMLRPFWPGADYTQTAYPEGCCVVDNPPFSILTDITNWYMDRGVRFFLFAPYLQNLGLARARRGVAHIFGAVSITYANGAEVDTAFLTNLEPDTLARSDPELYRRVKDANEQCNPRKHRPGYSYPREVLTSAMMGYCAKHGQQLLIRYDEAAFVRTLDAQRGTGKSVYGSGFLLSEDAAARKEAAMQAAADVVAHPAQPRAWELSDREREIIKNLSMEGKA